MDILIVQLKTTELILAAFKGRKGGVAFASAERHPLTGEEGELARILAESSLNRGEHRVALALPPGKLFMRELELPITDRAKVRELLPLELKGETALDTDELAFDALPLAEGKVLAVWGRVKELAEQVELFKEAGLEPEVVTASFFHWNQLAPDAGTVAVTDGEAFAAYRDGVPFYFRAFPAGSAEGEVDRTIAAMELGRGVKCDNVLSHAAGSRGSAPSVRRVTEAFCDDTRAAHDLAGAYAVAAAVADGSVVNLRRGPLAYTAATEKLYRRLRVSMILAALLVLLIFVEAGVRYYLVQRDLASLDGTIAGMYKEVFPGRKKAVDAVSELRSEIKRLEGARTSSNVLKLLKEVSDAKGDDVAGIYETEYDGSELRMKGEAKSAQAANDFKGRLSAALDGAEVSETKSRPDGSVAFTLHGKVKGVAR